MRTAVVITGLAVLVVTGCEKKAPTTSGVIAEDQPRYDAWVERKAQQASAPKRAELTQPIFGVNLGESIGVLGARFTLTPKKTDDLDDPAKSWNVATNDPALISLTVKSLDDIVFSVRAQMKDASSENQEAVKQALDARYGKREYDSRYDPFWRVRRSTADVEIRHWGNFFLVLTYVDVATEAAAQSRLEQSKADKLKGRL